MVGRPYIRTRSRWVRPTGPGPPSANAGDYSVLARVLACRRRAGTSEVVRVGEVLRTATPRGGGPRARDAGPAFLGGSSLRLHGASLVSVAVRTSRDLCTLPVCDDANSRSVSRGLSLPDTVCGAGRRPRRPTDPAVRVPMLPSLTWRSGGSHRAVTVNQSICRDTRRRCSVSLASWSAIDTSGGLAGVA